MTQNRQNIANSAPTPREFVRLWNQIGQALKKYLASNEYVSGVVTIMSLEYTPDLVQKVELVVARFAGDEENEALLRGITLFVAQKDESVEIKIDNAYESAHALVHNIN